MTRLVFVLACGWLAAVTFAADTPTTNAPARIAPTTSAPTPSGATNLAAYEADTLDKAIHDLAQTYGSRYPRAGEFLSRLEALWPRLGEPSAIAELEQLRREALLANPLLDFDRLLVIRRKPLANVPNRLGVYTGLRIGMPSNHECNASLIRLGWEDELATFSPGRPLEKMATLYRNAQGGYVGEINLHWDNQRLLFTQSDAENWKIFEILTSGQGLRQVSHMPADVDCMNPCYLPSGQIVFGSTASYQSVPCWHGIRNVSNLYRMDADGGNARQLCFDQDHDLHPTVLASGQILYNRWDYTGISHIYMRELMTMNPDGTGQRAIYGSNSWFPNRLYFARPLPGSPSRMICIISGYHGVGRMGQLVILDPTRGVKDTEGMVQRISGRGDPIRPILRDNLVDADWPKFLHPFPLSDKYFLVACLPDAKSSWGIYLADVFDNLVLLREEPGYALLEPTPMLPRSTPPILPDKTDPKRDDATVYVHDVYAGPGLAGVPRGTIKNLRIVAYDFGYRGLAGPDLIGLGGPWDAMRILGTVKVDSDGSALFHVPAATPVTLQPLDEHGQAVQLMRSWFSAQRGEMVSCVGCHERPNEVSPATMASALGRPAQDIHPWHGPARGFDFTREVQPVLDRNCVSCHDGRADAPPDLRRAELVKDYAGKRISDLAIRRMHPTMLAATKGMIRFGPAYEGLLPYIRRVGIEDEVNLLAPGEYAADVSPLIQLLRKGHAGVRLQEEDWDRLITWIDLNAPCHGRWSDVFPIPDAAHERRIELRRQFGGPADDPEQLPATAPTMTPRAQSTQPPAAAAAIGPAAPLANEPISMQQAPAGSREKIISLAPGISLKLQLIPAGKFIMGDPSGEPDESPATPVSIDKPFWIGACEISNEQFRCFDPAHRSGRYIKRHVLADDQGVSLDEPGQPAVRVSWDEAMAFCQWLSAKTRLKCTLPTEAQWEYACRGGSVGVMSYGSVDDDFSRWANVADRSFSVALQKEGKQSTGGVDHLVMEGAALADPRWNDGYCVTAPIGSYQANGFGLRDMHGNAAEWTRSLYRPYPWRDDDGRNDVGATGERCIRGGSFFDPPRRCRSASRRALPQWRRPFDTGFRIMCEQ